MKNDKIQLLHPAGKKNVNMDRKKYEMMKKAILRSLRNSPLKHKEMLEAILNDFRKNKKKFDGAVEWYMEGVKLDLEATKQIERLQEKPPHMWGLVRRKD